MALVAADRMVTLAGFMEFEHANPKMAHVSPYAVVLIAGDTLLGTRLATDVCATMAGTNPPLAAIASALSQHYAATRQTVMEEQLLKPRGLDLGSYYGRHATLNSQITMMLDQRLSEFNLGVELLLTGIDSDGAHIYSIHNPGGPELQHDVIGYGAIGSGAIHANQSMIGFGHHATVPFRDALYRTYAAKRRAEVAPGVGRDTDLIVISAEGTRMLDEEQIEELSKMYGSTQKATEQSLQKNLEELSIEVLKKIEADTEYDDRIDDAEGTDGNSETADGTR